MNEWFSLLITEICHKWGKEKVASEKIAEDISNDVGNRGEECIVYRLSLQDYYAERSPGSRTPADVYAIKDLGSFIHIALASVKSTATEKDAALLDSGEQKDAERFPSFVKDVVEKSGRIPEKIKERKIIISIGYAGIVFKNSKILKYPSVMAYCIKCEGINIRQFDLKFHGYKTVEDVYAKLSR